MINNLLGDNKKTIITGSVMDKLSNIHTQFLIDKNEHTDTNLIDGSGFRAPREILEMYQKMSFPSFKIWACLLIDIADKKYTTESTELPISSIWRTLGQRFTHDKLIEKITELQGIVINRDEYLPQSRGRITKSFQALGEAEIRSDQFDDVTMLQYNMMSGLMSILKSDKNEKFLIEMKMIRSLSGDKGGNAAKNIILLCTPHINNKRTPSILYNDLKKFMGLEKNYKNSDGSNNTKAFIRDVLKVAAKTINQNPYVNFRINEIIKTPSERNSTGVCFAIEPRGIIELLPGVDPSTPVDPNSLLTMLLNYWHAYVKDRNVSYQADVLKDLLKRLQLVDKYVLDFFNASSYDSDPAKGTFEIFSVTTSIFQLWSDGYFNKEDSKIYNYAIAVFKNPNTSKISSIVRTFFDQHQISIEKEQIIKQKSIRDRELFSRARRVELALKTYRKIRYEIVFSKYSKEEFRQKEIDFINKAMRKTFGIWIQKAAQKIDLENGTLNELLTRKTLDFFKEWLVNQAAKDLIIPDKSIVDFIINYPEIRPDLTYLNIEPKGMFTSFETLIIDLVAQFKK
jgi:hypothetical protein